jgi:serine/threonine protein kinase
LARIVTGLYGKCDILAHCRALERLVVWQQDIERSPDRHYMTTQETQVAQALEPPPPSIGGWTVQRRLGAGAMGEVYLAERDGKRAALKLVAGRFVGDDAFTTRFHREVDILKRFDHPHVARALDAGEHEGRPWLAMEFVNGPDIESHLAQHGPASEHQVLRLAIQLAQGLDHVHATAGLIHRDIKPANVLVQRAPGGDPTRLLNAGDVAKIIDFGLAKPADPDEGGGLTMTGMIMGTPNYISPEQIACEKQLTQHVDMYALGGSMYHMLTGQVPYPVGSAASVMAAHLNNAVPDPTERVPSLSSATKRVVMTAMAKRVADRYADWRAFIAACEKALSALGPEPAPQTNRFLKRPMPKPATAAQAKPPPVRTPATGSVARPTTAACAPSASGADALRAAATSRMIRKHGTSGTHRKQVEAATARTAATSAVGQWSGRQETVSSTGGSILPWIAVALAGLLAVAAVAWAITAG